MTQTTAHAVRIHAHGGPEVLQWEEIAVAAPGPGEVLIRNTAVGLNFIDTYFRSGLYKPPALPSGLGTEAAGVIEAVGPGVTEFAIGERVAHATGPLGAYATRRVMPVAPLVKLPDAIDDRTAAAMMLQGMTAQYLIHQTFPVQAGMTVLYHAVAGGVGQIALQWLKHLGVTVIGTVGSSEKAALAKSLGCDHVILYRQEDVAARVREITGGAGVPVVYDSVGKDTWDSSLNSLARRGMMVSYGNASGPVPPVAPLVLSQKGGLYLTRPTLAHYAGTRAELLTCAEALFDVVARGIVKIAVSQTFALSEAAQAHRALEGRQTTGSTVLIP
jgi:NADPH:quinone reductase